MGVFKRSEKSAFCPRRINKTKFSRLARAQGQKEGEKNSWNRQGYSMDSSRLLLLFFPFSREKNTNDGCRSASIEKSRDLSLALWFYSSFKKHWGHFRHHSSSGWSARLIQSLNERMLDILQLGRHFGDGRITM